MIRCGHFPVCKGDMIAPATHQLIILIIYVGAEGTCGAARSQFLDIRAAPSHDTAIWAPMVTQAPVALS